MLCSVSVLIFGAHSCEPPCRCWEQNWCPLEGQCFLSHWAISLASNALLFLGLQPWFQLSLWNIFIEFLSQLYLLCFRDRVSRTPGWPKLTDLKMNLNFCSSSLYLPHAVWSCVRPRLVHVVLGLRLRCRVCSLTDLHLQLSLRHSFHPGICSEQLSPPTEFKMGFSEQPP